MGITILKDPATGELKVSDGKSEIAIPLADLDSVLDDAKKTAAPTIGELRTTLIGVAETSDDPSAISHAAAALVSELARRENDERRAAAAAAAANMLAVDRS